MGAMFGGLKVVTITDTAAARIAEIVAKSADAAGEPALGLRIGITKGGCAGMEYTFEVAREVKPGDELVSDKGVNVVVEGKAVLFLFGSQLDFRAEKLSATFVVTNPNQTSACGCGESVAITPIAPEAVAAAR